MPVNMPYVYTAVRSIPIKPIIGLMQSSPCTAVRLLCYHHSVIQQTSEVAVCLHGINAEGTSCQLFWDGEQILYMGWHHTIKVSIAIQNQRWKYW